MSQHKVLAFEIRRLERSEIHRSKPCGLECAHRREAILVGDKPLRKLRRRHKVVVITLRHYNSPTYQPVCLLGESLYMLKSVSLHYFGIRMPRVKVDYRLKWVLNHATFAVVAQQVETAAVHGQCAVSWSENRHALAGLRKCYGTRHSAKSGTYYYHIVPHIFSSTLTVFIIWSTPHRS